MTDENAQKIFGILELMNTRFDGIDKRFDGMDKRSDGIESRLDKHDRQFETIIEMLVRHDNMMQNFVTRDDFNQFKESNAEAHDKMTKAIERLECESKAFNQSHSRLEGRVSKNEVAIKVLQAA